MELNDQVYQNALAGFRSRPQKHFFLNGRTATCKEQLDFIFTAEGAIVPVFEDAEVITLPVVNESPKGRFDVPYKELLKMARDKGIDVPPIGKSRNEVIALIEDAEVKVNVIGGGESELMIKRREELMLLSDDDLSALSVASGFDTDNLTRNDVIEKLIVAGA